MLHKIMKMSTIIIIAIVLISLGGIGAGMLAIGQFMSSSNDKAEIIENIKVENKVLKAKNDDLHKEIQILNDTLSKRDAIIQKKNNDIIDLNKELAKKSEYIANYVTGGNGYPVVVIEKYATSNDKAVSGAFTLKTSSEFPIYDLEVKVFNFDLMSASIKINPTTRKLNISEKDIEKAEIAYRQGGTLIPQLNTCLGNRFVLNESKYLIHFFSRGNLFVERMILVDFHSSVHFAYQVYTWKGNELLEQGFGSDEYPKEEKEKLLEQLNSIALNLEINKTE